MKLTNAIANPSSIKSSKSKYQYNVLIRGEKKVCSSHVEAVITTLKLLADKELIDLSVLEENEVLAGFPLLLDVTDIKNKNDIPDMLKKECEGRFKNRYQAKKLLVVNESTYIVCNQWTVERIDKFFNKMLAVANEKCNKKDLSTIERV